jgi:hypothetical protein
LIQVVVLERAQITHAAELENIRHNLFLNYIQHLPNVNTQAKWQRRLQANKENAITFVPRMLLLTDAAAECVDMGDMNDVDVLSETHLDSIIEKIKDQKAKQVSLVKT